MNYIEGQLRVWWIPQIPSKSRFTTKVKTIKEAKLLLEILANYDLYQLKNNIKPDYSNAGGLEEFKDSIWEEYMNEEGQRHR